MKFEVGLDFNETPPNVAKLRISSEVIARICQFNKRDRANLIGGLVIELTGAFQLSPSDMRMALEDLLSTMPKE